jgi:CBS domain
VLDGLGPVGILPSARISQTPSEKWATVRVRDAMLSLSQVPPLKPDEPAFDAMLALAGTGADSALVLESGRLVGIVYARDVADSLGSGTHRPWAHRSRRSGSRSPAFPVGARPVTVPGHETGTQRDVA